jgi:hypothetical protein
MASNTNAKNNQFNSEFEKRSNNKNNQNLGKNGFLYIVASPEDEVRRAMEKYKRCIKKNKIYTKCKVERDDLIYAQVKMYSFYLDI